ncbi:uncharacterized protein BJ171DRAFT_422235 [Polychytrium aggregatum]|uniref:uncharacterized protein n=1 Tax=Polychytrium aggregatum TaxID=110093 RepID=UPI0022FDE09C|nr:uncharacterized protein BJ171DRAFT_422235 [Polychytrium aggregatum]KAI9206513.1 hypothetical protein BJ171DRAFT_422235 [Polychytrium aggregatum]
MGGSVAMQWHRSEVSGNSAPPPLRAHTMTLVKDKIFVFGGCDASVCFNTLYIFDPDSLWWAKAKTRGNIPPPCRAHSTNYENNKLWVFGGGDGPYYYNHLYVLDCDTLTWSIPETTGVAPGPRRAHSSWIYDKALWIYAGGDGVQALGDMFKLDLATLAWTKVTGVMGSVPPPRGYHTSTIVNNTVIMYGGSDGHECFSDIYIFHLEELRWNRIQYERPAYSRLSHTATLVGSFLFIIGGHDGTSYSSEVLMLNLITMEWEQRLVVGLESPGERGYHSACYNDSRVFVFGGYNGQEVFNDMFILDLSSVAYLTQTSDFEITMLDDKKIIGI